MLVSIVILYSLAYNAVGVMDVDNIANVLTTQVQASIVVIGSVRKQSIKPIVFAKQWRITLQNAQ